MTEYQRRSTERIIEVLRSGDQNPRSWQQEAASRLSAMQEALQAVEWRGHQGKCPLCAGWDMSPQGETPGKHTKDCLIRLALTSKPLGGE